MLKISVSSSLNSVGLNPALDNTVHKAVKRQKRTQALVLLHVRGVHIN